MPNDLSLSPFEMESDLFEMENEIRAEKYSDIGDEDFNDEFDEDDEFYYEDTDFPYDTDCLDTSFHDYEMDV